MSSTSESSPLLDSEQRAQSTAANAAANGLNAPSNADLNAPLKAPWNGPNVAWNGPNAAFNGPHGAAWNGAANGPWNGGQPGVEGVGLEWHELSVTLELPIERRIWPLSLLFQGGAPMPTRPVLDNVSGAATAGETLAIMGPSGAGKTTLLDVLTGRIPNYEGQILVNGRPAAKGQLRQLSVCVMQDDILMRTLTVRECLTFSARLRLPRHMTVADKTRRVVDLIAKLGLGKCADTRVMELSGGERKRTAIAVELVTDPRLLFLDEPTSGLDSATALNVMQLITRLASVEGRTVVTTIHQPSSEIFSLFQRLLLLVDGHAAYDGPAHQAVAYFGALGYPCPLYSNPADYIIKVLSRDQEEAPVAYDDRIARILQHKDARSGKWLKGITSSAGAINMSDDGPPPRPTTSGGAPVRLSEPGASNLEEFWLLTVRSVKGFVREAMSLRVRIANAVLLGLMMSMFWFDLDDDVLSIKDRFASLFFVTAGQILAPALTLVLTFPMERSVFMREQDNRVYSVHSYYLAKVVSEMPFGLVLGMIFSLIVYWMIGYNTAETSRFFIFYMSVYLLSFNSQAIGIMVGSGVPDPMAALAAAPIILIPLMMFAGFFADLSELPSWFAWIQYISPFKFGYEMLLVNEFTDLPIRCEWPEGFPDTVPCPLDNGNLVLRFLDLSYRDIWVSVFALLLQTLMWHLLAFSLLHFWIYRRRYTNVRG